MVEQGHRARLACLSRERRPSLSPDLASGPDTPSALCVSRIQATRQEVLLAPNPRPPQALTASPKPSPTASRQTQDQTPSF